MVIQVQCPAAACRKFMLVEAADRGRVVPCLLCRAGVPVPAADAPARRDVESLEPVAANDDELLGLT